ncbi:DUF3379 family protein [Alteromonas facilis]|uniref:DUF3379 family protein n=1 Tax=Alteromonas facilis TaxID=2048004 RepID=UPI0013DB0114|nr:DUF3379 family protein [Alteromonas facilis]
MDELEFRRVVYSDPNTQDPRVLAAIQADPAKKAFVEELKALDEQLLAASKVPVPETLASKLIWQGTISDYASHKKRTRVYLSMAASVAFVVGISFTLWHQQTGDIGQEALAHMYYTEASEGPRATTVSLTQVNDRLSGFGATLVGDIGVLKSANYCTLDAIKSLHLIVETSEGLVSVFVLPEDKSHNVLTAFSDYKYAGEILKPERANVLIVGEKQQNLSKIKQDVAEKLLFSA